MTVSCHYLAGGREHGGGIGRMVGYIVDAAAARGERHDVVDTRGPHWSPVRSTPRLLAAAARIAGHGGTRDRIAHIHVAGRGSTVRKIALCAAARASGAPHVLHLHDFDYESDLLRRPGWQQALVRRMFQGADRVVVLGLRDRATVMLLLGVHPARVTVLANAVPDPGPPAPRHGVPTVLFLGALGERKGVPELLAALASPRLAGYPWRAVLAGGGPVERYRAEVSRLGLGGRVDLPGWLGEAETVALCASSDILALPSHSEGLSMAVLEGLAHGLAVVTTPVGAHPEVICDGSDGLLVPPGDVAALTDALETLLATPTIRSRLGAAGRDVFLMRYSMSSYMTALGALYDGVLTRRAAGVALGSAAR